MKANRRFLNQPKHFWANVRTIGELVGYTKEKKITIPSIPDIQTAFAAVDLGTGHLANKKNRPTAFGDFVISYFEYRAHILNNHVKLFLMNIEQAEQEFNSLKKRFSPHCPIPMNKQKGSKRTPAYFTSIINILIEANSRGLHCDYDPRRLTTITRNGAPLRTFARRIDGAFTSVINPIAVWEVKEYYHTTSFGSRVADGVYESLLDGMEIDELKRNENIELKHYLMIDGYSTWWEQGLPYLCRIIDLLHMGYADEVLFGREVMSRMPVLVKEWVKEYGRRS